MLRKILFVFYLFFVSVKSFADVRVEIKNEKELLNFFELIGENFENNGQDCAFNVFLLAKEFYLNKRLSIKNFPERCSLKINGLKIGSKLIGGGPLELKLEKKYPDFSLYSAKSSQFEVATGGYGFARNISEKSSFVYKDGVDLVEARWPEVGYRKLKLKGGELQFDIGTDEWPEKILVKGYWSHPWAFEAIPMVRGNGSNYLFQAENRPKFQPLENVRVYVDGVYGGLNVKDRWYFDGDDKKIYVSSEGGGGYYLIVLNNVIHIEKSNNIAFSNLIVIGARGSAIEMLNVKNVNFTDGVVRESGGACFNLLGEKISITNTKIFNCGEGGVVIRGGDRYSLVSSKNYIANNYIYNYDRLAKSYRPGVLMEGAGGIVKSNEIFNGNHSAIIFGGNNHEIQGNYIHDIVRESDDAGAIYAGRDWLALGNKIFCNKIDKVGAPNSNTAAIYLDDQINKTLVYGNYMSNVKFGVLIGGGSGNEVYENVFESVDVPIHLDARGKTWQLDATLNKKSDLQKSKNRFNYLSDEWLKNYPDTGAYFVNEGRPILNVIFGNKLGSGRNNIDLSVDKNMQYIDSSPKNSYSYRFDCQG